MSSPLQRVLGALTALTLLGTLGACGGEEVETDAAEATPSVSASAETSRTATPSSSPSGAAPTATPTPTTGGGQEAAGTLAAALLAPDELPGLNQESRWTRGTTRPAGTSSFGWCLQFDALTLGASEALQRSFRAPGGSAAQQVLDLVDATNARRAEQVLLRWHSECGGGRLRVGPIQQLGAQTAAESAWWYLSSRSGGQGRWEAFGVARDGGRLTLLRMRHPGQDHSYAPGQDPLERGLEVAANKLEG